MSRFFEDKGYRAFRILQFAFIAIPIIAGLDKFFYFLANWTGYLSPHALEVLKGQGRTFLMIAGACEIIAGIGIIFKPKVFAYLIALWLLAIMINLIFSRAYLDIALKDFGLLLGALALGNLAVQFEKK